MTLETEPAEKNCNTLSVWHLPKVNKRLSLETLVIWLKEEGMERKEGHILAYVAGLVF